MKQTSLVKSKGITKSIELFKSYCCKNCGSVDVDVFKSNNGICLKCDDCNERVIFKTDERKQGALGELDRIYEYYGEQEMDNYVWIGFTDYLSKRIEELEKEGVEQK